MTRVIQSRYLDIPCLPSQKQTKKQKNSFIWVQQAKPDDYVVHFTSVYIWHVNSVVILLIRLQAGEISTFVIINELQNTSRGACFIKFKNSARSSRFFKLVGVSKSFKITLSTNHLICHSMIYWADLLLVLNLLKWQKRITKFVKITKIRAVAVLPISCVISGALAGEARMRCTMGK